MALKLPPNFEKDIQSNNTNLTPVIAIANTETLGGLPAETAILLSTNTLSLNCAFDTLGTTISVDTIPILMNVPSLRESMDLQKRNYKIPSLSISINNFIYEGQRFSERHGRLINSNCRVYWVSPNTDQIAFYDLMTDDELENYPNRALQTFFGKIRRYKHNDSTASLTIEDKSQLTLHKELPTAYVPAGENAKPSEKNKKIPMVYGYVENSPCVARRKTETNFGTEAADIEIIADLNQSVKIIEDSVKTIIEDNMLEVLTDVPNYEQASFDFIKGKNVLDYNKGIATMTASAEESEDEGVTGNPLSQNQVILKETRALSQGNTEEMKIIPIRGWSRYWSYRNDVGEAYYTSLTTPSKTGIQGTLVRDRGHHDGLGWDGYSLLQQLEPDTNGLDAGPDNIEGWNGIWTNKDNMAILACDVETGVTTDYVDNYGILTIAGRLFVNGTFFTAGDYTYTRVIFRVGTYADDESFSTENQRVYKDEIGSAYGNAEQWSDGYVASFSQSTFNQPNNEIWLKDTGKLFLYVRANHGDETPSAIGAGRLQFDNIMLRHYLLVDNANKLSYFADTQGRTGENATIHNIVNDILVNDLDLDEDSILLPSTQAYGASTWYYDFAIKDTINSKKIIERLSSVSPFIPRFDNLGNFTFTKIPKDNEIASHPPIKDEDVIDFSFKRTDPEELYSKIVFSYDWDYPREVFSKRREVSIGGLESIGLLNNYDSELYGTGYTDEIKLKEMEEGYISNSTLVIEDDRGKLIREDNTALYYASWLLSWHCNQHLKMKVKLPLRYMGIEIGDIVEFDKILQGIKPYQIDYKNGSVLNGGQAAFPKFFVFSTNKTMEFVEIELIQLHQLFTQTGEEQAVVYGCTIDNACNYNPDANTDDGSCWFVPEGCDCAGDGEGTQLACGICCGGIGDDTVTCESLVADGLCEEDCEGTIGGSVTEDECGVCGGGGVLSDECDCDGNVFDDCGVCGGNNETCGCNENPNFSLNYDPNNSGCPSSEPDCCKYINYDTSCIEDLEYPLQAQEIINQDKPEDARWMVSPSHIPRPEGENDLLFNYRKEEIIEQYQAHLADETKPYPSVYGFNESCYNQLGHFKSFRAFGTTITELNQVIANYHTLDYRKLSPEPNVESNDDLPLGAYNIVNTKQITNLQGAVSDLTKTYFEIYKIKNDETEITKIEISFRISRPKADGVELDPMNMHIVPPDSDLELTETNFEEILYNCGPVDGGGYMDCPHKLIFGEVEGAVGDIEYVEDGADSYYKVEFLGYHHIDDDNGGYKVNAVLAIFESMDEYIKNNSLITYSIYADVKIEYANGDEQTYDSLMTLQNNIVSCSVPGDANGDEIWDVLDIVFMANCVLNQTCSDLTYACQIDVNGDTYYNVLDIVAVANCILNQDCSNLGE